jgi:hypothetical protein
MAMATVGRIVTETKNRLCSANSDHENRRRTMAPRRRPHGIAEHGEYVAEDGQRGGDLVPRDPHPLDTPPGHVGVPNTMPVAAGHPLVDACVETRGHDFPLPSGWVIPATAPL